MEWSARARVARAACQPLMTPLLMPRATLALGSSKGILQLSHVAPAVIAVGSCAWTRRPPESFG